MRFRKVLSLCCVAAMLAGLFCGVIPTPVEAVPNFTRIITISSPYIPSGSINPAAFVDGSAAPFNVGGPFTVTGYYRFNKLGEHGAGAAAYVFDVPISDTKGQWKTFTASFNTEPSFAAKGLVLWYMAGEISVAGLVIKNAAGQVVYDLETDNLPVTDTTSNCTKGIWYFWNYGNSPDFAGAISVLDNSTGLVDYSGYSLSGNRINGVSYGTDVLTVRSNFRNNETMTAWRGNTQLKDTDLVTPDVTFYYNKAQNGARTYVLNGLVGDPSNDGKMDIRDLRLIKEAAFGDMTLNNNATGDIDCNGAVNQFDTDQIRNALTGGTMYTKQSVGADTLLKMANPVGRLVKESSRLYMEHSACNFTLTGYFKGDVIADISIVALLTDQVGLYVEVDGISNMSYIKLTARDAYQTVKLASGLPEGKHTIRVYKATDAKNDVLRISAIKFTGKLLQTPVASRRIEFLGDSITAGACIFDPSKHAADYNVYGQTASWFGYAKKTADALGASHYSVANGGWRLCYSAGAYQSIRSIYPYVSMHNTISKGAYSFDYDPDVVVINLGTNDWSQNKETYQKDARELLQIVRAKNPRATIVWAYGMMDQDHASVEWLRETVNQFAASDGNTHFIAMNENTNGWYAHPDKNAHAQAGNTLANFIRNIKGW